MPSPNGPNGRDSSGRFTAGNPGGPGNPFAPAVARLRAAMLQSVTVKDVRDLGRSLLERAKAGDVPAARLLLAYLLGPPEILDADTNQAAPTVVVVRDLSHEGNTLTPMAPSQT